MHSFDQFIEDPPFAILDKSSDVAVEHQRHLPSSKRRPLLSPICSLQKKLEDTSTALETDIARALEEARGRLEAIFLDRQEMRGDINKVVELIAGLQVHA